MNVLCHSKQREKSRDPSLTLRMTKRDIFAYAQYDSSK